MLAAALAGGRRPKGLLVVGITAVGGSDRVRSRIKQRVRIGTIGTRNRHRPNTGGRRLRCAVNRTQSGRPICNGDCSGQWQRRCSEGRVHCYLRCDDDCIAISRGIERTSYAGVQSTTGRSCCHGMRDGRRCYRLEVTITLISHRDRVRPLSKEFRPTCPIQC